MKLYHGRGSCSLGILLLLEELGLRFHVEIIDLAAGEQRSAEFLAINPKGKVPFLVLDDGTTISEWPAIAAYLAGSDPERTLLPSGPREMAEVLEAVEFMVSTVHMQGFTRIVRPGNFAPGEDDHPAVKARGMEIFRGGLEAMSAKLGDGQFLFGEMTIADAALFYLENWMANRLGEPLPDNCDRHLKIMTERPAAARALAA